MYDTPGDIDKPAALFFLIGHAQEDITKAEGEELENQLKAAHSDSSRIFLLIKVAKYHTIGNF